MRKFYTITVKCLYKEQEVINQVTKDCTEIEATLEAVRMIHNHLLVNDEFVSLEIREKVWEQ